MIFGKDRDKGLVMDGHKLKVVKIGENGITKTKLLIALLAMAIISVSCRLMPRRETTLRCD